MHKTAIRFLACALAAYLSASVSGAFLAPDYDTRIPQPEVIETLDWVFRPELGTPLQLAPLQGEYHHGRLARMSFVSARLDAPGGQLLAEQVLKVGWPFTISRGFIHQVGTTTHVHGAFLLGPESGLPHGAVLPFQPVWPGVVFWGLIGAFLLGPLKHGAGIAWRKATGRPGTG